MLCYFFEVFRICRSKWKVSNSRIEAASVMVEDDSFWEPVIKASGSRILGSMQRLGNMCCFITLGADMVFGFLEISVLNFNKQKRALL